MMRLFVTLLIFLTSATATAQTLRPTQVLTSNHIIALAGSGDTLWIATERGFNYRILSGGNENAAWNGFESSNMLHRFWGLAFGGGKAAAVVDNSSDNTIGFWQFDHAQDRQREIYFRYNNLANLDDDLAPLPMGNVIFSHGNFWAPFNTGGLVRYDPNENRAVAIGAGENVETPPQNFTFNENNINNRVLSTSVININGDDFILVTTPAAILTYDPANRVWETLHDNQINFSDEVNFISFNAAFVNENNGSQTLYSFIDIEENGTTATVLYVYDSGGGHFARAQNFRERFSISPAINGLMYALFDGNEARLLAQIPNDNMLREIMRPNDFRDLFMSASGNANPQIKDVVFLPQTATSGILAIATTTGLYIWNDAHPLDSIYNDFIFARHVREVSRGEAYALPGVIRSSFDGRYDRAVFVYRLRRDGNVTIRIFDYNMSPVKTVVRGEHRAAAPRSNDPSRDFWDGTNDAGRRVAPGVYYFRISSTGGDRFTGRVILAK